MKKIQIAMVCLLAVTGMMMTGCKKEGEIVTLKAIIDTENDAKAYLNGDNIPVWESGDPVWVNGEQKAVTASSSSPTNGTIAGVESSANYLAVYPYDDNVSRSGASVTVNIPRVQNFVPNGNGQKVAPTMAAYTVHNDNGSNTLFFKNLHSLIEVTVKNTTSTSFSIKRIVVNSSNKITGSATATMTTSGDVDNDNITMNSISYNDATLEFDDNNLATIAANNTTGVKFYIAVAPLSNCATFTVTIYTNDSKYIGVQFSNVTLDRSHIAPVTITKSANQPLKECGRFTIDREGHQVNFASGNLQFYRHVNDDGSIEDKWRFASHQYDFVGSGYGYTPSTDRFKGNVSSSDNKIHRIIDGANRGTNHTLGAWIDLFGWGTGNDPLNFNTNKTTFTEWHNYSYPQIIGSEWYTLSKDEWNYILDSRTTNLRFLKAKIKTGNSNYYVYGLILFPDGFAWPSHVVPSATIYGKINSKTDNFTESITVTQWTSLENKGAIFLPAGGYRTLRGGCNYSGISSNEVGSISDAGAKGFYWASDEVSSNTNNANNLRFFSNNIVTPTAGGEKKTGYSVRLVKNVQ